MFSFPLPSSTHADVAEHAVAVLNALQGDWREALCHMDLYRAEYGSEYAGRLARLVILLGLLIEKGAAAAKEGDA
jgi:hypothetical protein